MPRRPASLWTHATFEVLGDLETSCLHIVDLTQGSRGDVSGDSRSVLVCFLAGVLAATSATLYGSFQKGVVGCVIRRMGGRG